MAWALLAAALGIVGYGVAHGGGFSARFAALVGRTSRSRVVLGWAMGTGITYGLSSLVALALLGRGSAVAIMPDELAQAAWGLGLPARSDATVAATLGGCALLGAAGGVAILWVRRRMGRGAIGLRYRSPAAATSRGEAPAAIALALAAGVGEELFFRLLLPLLFALTIGSANAGFAVSLVAFTMLHRHQGTVGMVAVAITGAALTYLYLLTGALWVLVVVHVAIDLNALILRPWLTRPLSSSAASPS